jgi:tetratricopeptide (TPR) repeat protein
MSTELLDDAERLVLQLQLEDALALLVPITERYPNSVRAQLLVVRAMTGLERYAAALSVVDALLRQPLAPRELAAARYHRARLLRRTSPFVDEAIELALQAAQLAEKQGDTELAVDARCEAAALYCRKRCQRLAERELERAALHGPDLPRIASARGWVAVEFDDRAAALAAFDEAIAQGGDGTRLGHLGRAHVLTLLGQFTDAHHELAALAPWAAGDLLVRRLAAALLDAEGKPADAAQLYEELATLSPLGDFARELRFQAAEERYQSGDLPAAVAGWKRAQLEAEPHDRAAVAAARALRLLEQPGAESRPHRRLRAFPSVAQLRDHCGPAACELYLRYFGIGAEQVEIARAIKVPGGGTPVYRMRQFLEQAGLTCRRVEADLPRLRALIDAGIPVIMEEDYSDTRHVTVAIGYDDRREVLEVQDPMTHDVRETAYEDLPRLRNLSNHGALVGVPATDATLVAALESCGAAETRYISLVDEAWAALDGGDAAKGDALVLQALALREDYELAWLYRFRRAREAMWEKHSPELAAELHRLVAEVQRLWPDDEWPEQLAGELLFATSRWSEALSAFETAAERDPADAHNWQMMGECLLELGRDEDARNAFRHALERNPAHVRANENAALACFNAGSITRAWIANDAARELNPGNAFNHVVHAKLLTRQADLGAAKAALEEALRLEPTRRDAFTQRVELLGRMGLVDEGAAAFAQRIASGQGDVGTRVDQADFLYRHGRFAAAAAAAATIVVEAPELASGPALLGASRAQLGELEVGFELLGRALAISPSYSWVHAQRGKVLGGLGRWPEAIASHAAAAGLSRLRPDMLADLGRALVRAGHAPAGWDYLQQAALAGDFGERELVEIGEMLVASRHHVQHLFEDIARRRPGDPEVLRAHARILLEVLWAPDAARTVIDELGTLRPEDPFVLAFAGAELMDDSLAGEDAGEALIRRAVAAAPTLVAPRRLLADRLLARGRHAEALAALEGAGTDYSTVHTRVRALIGLDRPAEVDAQIAAFEAEHGRPGHPAVGAMMLSYRVLRWRGDWRGALALVETIAREQFERDDDGRLDAWEAEKFECLARLGETERAIHFGERQALDAESLSRLARDAASVDAYPLAAEMARRALKLDPHDTSALHVMARLAELAGRNHEALERWQQIGDLEPGWHVAHEHIARVLLGVGDPNDALDEAELGIEEGHVCAWAFAVRGQARLLLGDTDGAREDLDRSWGLADVETRGQTAHDVWGFRALAAGDPAEADRHFAIYLREGAPISPADRERVARIRGSVQSAV